MNDQSASAWQETVTIPTYPVGQPDRNPMFLEKRVYQGSSGAVYPFPVIDKIFDEKVDQKWDAVFLENKYIKVMLLPQLGGLDDRQGIAARCWRFIVVVCAAARAGAVASANRMSPQQNNE